MKGAKTGRRCHVLKPGLLDLPEGVLTSILKLLPVYEKCESQLVCRKFRDIVNSPSKGAYVWDTIHLENPVFDDPSPTELAWWLIQRVRGIRSLQFWPIFGTDVDAYKPPERVLTSPKLQRLHQIVVQVLPQLPALLSPEAEIRLDLSIAITEALLGSQEPTASIQHRNNFVDLYWAGMASSLTMLNLTYGFNIGPATTSALSQLTRLEELSLNGGMGTSENLRPSAHVSQSLPELWRLRIYDFAHVRLSLSCPQLRNLTLMRLSPLETLEGVPQGVVAVSLRDLAEGSLSLTVIFQGQPLERLEMLNLAGFLPEIYDDPGVVEVIKRPFGNGKLDILSVGCPLEKLTPLEGPQCALPNSLISLTLHLPLTRGLPVVLEQLTNLKSFTAINSEEGPMHLDRPLDAFLDMPRLEHLTFSQAPGRAGYVYRWTPCGLKFLGLASQRIAEGTLLPSGKELA